MAYDKNPDGSYADLEYSKFPAEVDSWQNSEDVTAEYLSLANDYKTALLSGSYTNAQNILNANPRLKHMIFKAEDINKLKQAIMAVERLFTEDIDDLLQTYSDKATTEADKATTAANNASISEKNSSDSKDIAISKANEANQLVENLKTLKGTLPNNFTEYTKQVLEHNSDSSAHQDIRKEIEDSKYTLPVATAIALGGVKIGNGLTVDEDGTVSADSALAAWPVGSIYQTIDYTSPASLFGGSWTQIGQNRVLMGASSDHPAGTTAEAGLPNITGYTTHSATVASAEMTQWGYDDTSGGALTQTHEGGWWTGYTNTKYFQGHVLELDASKSSPVYGASDTVQPPAYYVYIWRRVA